MWYGFEWTRGIGTWDSDTNLPVGYVKIFREKYSRDNWVSQSTERNGLDSDSARAYMLKICRIWGIDENLFSERLTKDSPIERIAEAYRNTYGGRRS